MTASPAAWTADAACVGTPPEAWFPGVGEPVTLLRRICRDCPVRTECLNLAMRAENTHVGRDHRHGVYGGLSPAERHALAKTWSPS